ncbi:MAG: hypothetical protein KDJ80_02090 [Nitratireductor sp.]|nr:hypothetical protein [Nitratireductor sp.]
MNRIVKKHYPASKLPEELREGIPVDGLVEIQVTAESAPATSQRELIGSCSGAGPVGDNEIDEAVERIRALRDEWGER